jgi:hypothetical protein
MVNLLNLLLSECFSNHHLISRTRGLPSLKLVLLLELLPLECFKQLLSPFQIPKGEACQSPLSFLEIGCFLEEIEVSLLFLPL